MISIKQLQVFAAIARYGNLSQAAEALFLSKGAVSQSLAELERQLATQLFDRVHPRLQLNSQGQQLQPLADEVLARVQDINQLFRAEAIAGGTLRLGASQTIGNYLLPQLLAAFPEADIRVEISNTHKLCQQLANFELDLALIEGRSHLPQLQQQPWLQDEMLLVAAQQHPLAQYASVQLTDLENAHWVLREAHSGSRELFEQQLAPKLTKVGRILELNSLEAVMLAVEQGLGLTLISKLAAARHLHDGTLKQLPLALHFPRQLSLVWHQQKYLSALAQQFIHHCQHQSFA
ncbi:LysR substrate-binding domain-containing protein [Shewanella dokdonensis]|uniref:LysR family transcriptional regulator n=1 Tax=Shewanella dokdonensis TaxID=712036 RepID=A0ABX8DI44_9GAMM|nr:LysR substrate-binding domain-containing protein [Shewanella dokdonensis]MCL1076161.1 LysR substrate-binding domain-containing protein [Shewanella dokdonensis]QVK24453.1 LysR family transcriptional regulator [Shewanella dokdonensis]